MQKYALLGWPVGHSRSPRMQLAGFQALGIQATYECLAIPPGEFPEQVAALPARGFVGWNVTVPHKERMYAACHEVAGEEARAARSVNTVVVREGRTYGYSTDGIGVARALEHDFGFREAPARQLYLGAGGAAQAAAMYAARHGAREIYLANRTLEKARELAERIRQNAPGCQVHALPLDQAPQAVSACDILFPCTSLGLHQGDPMPIPPDAIPPDLPVFDFVYTPSAFRNALQAKGNPVCDGREMLLQQGMESFRLWTGQEAPEADMRRGLDSY